MTELDHYRGPDRNPAALTFASVPDAMALAEQIAPTGFVPTAFRGKPAEILAAILTGAELGLPPMTSLAKIHVIEGKPGIAAELMRALVLARGHELWLEDASNTKVTLGGRRAGSKETTRITWTIDDAKSAGLDRKNVWRNYPRAMLTARATGELCRLIFADVLAGISYAEEELRDGFTLDEAEIPEAAEDRLPGRPEDVAPPAPPKTTRKAADKAAPKTRKAPEPAPAAPAPPLPGEDGIPAAEAPTPPVEDHVHGDTVPGSGPSYTPAQALAIRAREVGLDDETRRGVYLAVTAGRAASGKDLDREEIETVFEVFRQIDEGTASVVENVGRWAVMAEGGTVFDSGPNADVPSFIEESPSTLLDVESSEVPPEPENGQEGPGGPRIRPNPGDEGEWKEFLAGLRPKGKIADALRAAAALSGDPKAAPTLAKLAEDEELSAKVATYLLGEES